MPDAMLLAMPGLDWGAGYLYDGYVKFGMWDEMLREPSPNEKLTGRLAPRRQRLHCQTGGIQGVDGAYRPHRFIRFTLTGV